MKIRSVFLLAVILSIFAFTACDTNSDIEYIQFSEASDLSHEEILDFATTEDELSIEIVDEEKHEHYHFRNQKLLEQHYEKHGKEMGFDTIHDYQEAACEVINSPDALYKTEAEDGDGVYYIVDTNEFVILSTDGYIRTYFEPSSGLKYFERQ